MTHFARRAVFRVEPTPDEPGFDMVVYGIPEKCNRLDLIEMGGAAAKKRNVNPNRVAIVDGLKTVSRPEPYTPGPAPASTIPQGFRNDERIWTDDRIRGDDRRAQFPSRVLFSSTRIPRYE